MSSLLTQSQLKNSNIKLEDNRSNMQDKNNKTILTSLQSRKSI
jgi:hypothetical protein